MKLCHELALHIVVLPEEAAHQSVPCRFMPVLRECLGGDFRNIPGVHVICMFFHNCTELIIVVIIGKCGVRQSGRNASMERGKDKCKFQPEIFVSNMPRPGISYRRDCILVWLII